MAITFANIAPLMTSEHQWLDSTEKAEKQSITPIIGNGKPILSFGQDCFLSAVICSISIEKYSFKNIIHQQ
jgi:hypothetical protein